MERFTEILISSFTQLVVVLFLCLFVFGILRLFRKNKTSFLDSIGLRKPTGQIDKTFFFILMGMILFSAASLIVQYYFSPTFKSFLLGETSPYGKILKGGFGPIQILSGLLYCFANLDSIIRACNQFWTWTYSWCCKLPKRWSEHCSILNNSRNNEFRDVSYTRFFSRMKNRT